MLAVAEHRGQFNQVSGPRRTEHEMGFLALRFAKEPA
jgi:hypothetical protein